MKNISSIAKILGAFVAAAIIFGIPVLTTCAFVFNWYSGIKMMLLFLSLIDFLVLWIGFCTIEMEY